MGIEETFLALPLDAVADAALSRARALGATHASVRVERIRAGRLAVHDGELRGSEDTTDVALGVRVVAHGSWGFAASADVTPQAAAVAAEEAVAIARVCAGLGGAPVVLADEPVHRAATWHSSYRVDPFQVPESTRLALLSGWCRELAGARGVRHAAARVTAHREQKFYADSAGTRTVQQRIRVHPQLTVLGLHPRDGVAHTLRTVGPPTARGWEYLDGDGWDWRAELAELPELLAGKVQATPVRPGRYDLVVDPSQLWLTIHESVGHATEYDRAVGAEMSYAGGTFARPELLGELRYGSPLMEVTGDRTTPHGLATAGFDDEGVAAQLWPLVEGGVLTGFQHDRGSAALAGLPRSTGCAYAESGLHAPISRMPNVSLRPAPDGPDLAGLIGGVEDGLYLAGADSWSIDMQRRQFQFTGQRCHRIRHGRLAEQVSGVAYRAETTGFWAALAALGGPQTYLLSGADLCGKGQPVQAASASHGCPAALFNGIDVINTGGEALT